MQQLLTVDSFKKLKLHNKQDWAGKVNEFADIIHSTVWRKANQQQKGQILEYEGKFNDEPQFQHFVLTSLLEIFRNYDGDSDGIIQRNEFVPYYRYREAWARMNGFPVFPLSNLDISKLFEVYESLNSKYEGFKFEDVVQCDELLTKKSREKSQPKRSKK